MPIHINGETIEDDVVDNEMQRIKAAEEHHNPHASCCSMDDEFREQARENLTARVLLAQEAKRVVEPIAPDEIDAALAELIEEHGGAEQFYANMGLTPDQEADVRRDLAMNLQVRKLVEQLRDETPPTDAELRSYYEENIEEWTTAERVRASHVLMTPDQGQNREEVFEQMRELRRRALNGEDFDAIALEFSDKAKEAREQAEQDGGAEAAQAAAQHGARGDGVDLGFFARGELMPEFEYVAFSMNIDEVSPVFATGFGYHLVKVTERDEPTPVPLDEVRDEVVEAFLLDRHNDAVQAKIAELQDKAEIKVVDYYAEDEEAEEHAEA
ncbi:MAG: hypothetical protein GC159_10815 [Phycisphaera sp.]|nr:hypothetical protein [Phycisphaera sp.]